MLDSVLWLVADKMLLVTANRERNERFLKFFSSHRVMFVSLRAAQFINYINYLINYINYLINYINYLMEVVG